MKTIIQPRRLEFLEDEDSPGNFYAEYDYIYIYIYQNNNFDLEYKETGDKEEDKMMKDRYDFWRGCAKKWFFIDQRKKESTYEYTKEKMFFESNTITPEALKKLGIPPLTREQIKKDLEGSGYTFHVTEEVLDDNDSEVQEYLKKLDKKIEKD